MIYLHKILPLIVSPLFFVIFLIILGTILKSKKINLAAIVTLIILSLPIVSNKLIAYLENDYALLDSSTIKNAEAIVVLSGMLKTVKSRNNFKYEFEEAVDRILAGIELYKNNKAPILILTRGKLPWSLGKPEGEILKDFAIKYNVAPKDILLTENVENTDQEAKSVNKILKSKNNIILVTSAFHMPRAQKVFKAANFNVVPYPVDFQSSVKKITFMDFIPSANSFSRTSHFVREIIGRLYYSLKY